MIGTKFGPYRFDRELGSGGVSIGDEKSGTFMREGIIGGLKNVTAFCVDGLRGFWGLVAEVSEGAKERLPEVEAGVGGLVQFSMRADLERYDAEVRPLMAETPTGRESAGFEPSGDGLLEVE